MTKDTYTPREVARIMGKHEQTVWKYLRKGLIPGAEKFGRTYLIWKQPFDAARKKEHAA